ncbi:uncharacterized protein MEPE_06635 [Melanopsichium pennsylvanicum]|uniref:C3H1-type domain-containing protein n=2 Tax=Melanopsichium pennsylvanicum TaxID=63383 RepID=A0AAJ4XRH9_9BASI|nr:putative protein [Melanopsichium pennsylvanicum 4]SNX87924.1 uncharacterized protein MEPE_06635 [Melanopsichium pennsylvanicum]
MDPSSGYGSWPMQPNSNPELAWHLEPNSLNTSSVGNMQPMYVSSLSVGAMPSTLYPAYPSSEHQYVPQQQQSYQQQSQLYPPQPQLHSHQYPSASLQPGMPASDGSSSDALSVNAANFNELRVMYPDASSETLISAIFQPPPSAPRSAQPHPQHQDVQRQQLVPAPVAQTRIHHPSHQMHPSHDAPLVQPPPPYNAYASQSEHSLANALSFTSPPPVAANTSSIFAHGLSQPAVPAVQPQAHAGTGSTAQPEASKKTAKLRQSKLSLLPGVAHAVRIEGTPPTPAVTAPLPKIGAEAAIIVDDGAEPSTPPLPPAKALATRPSSSATATSADTLLWNKVKAPLSRLSVERSPDQSARQLVQLLCEVDASGKFRQVVSTGSEVRETIIETLHAIATLEKGRGFTDNGRSKFFGAMMRIPGGRHILSTWLRQTVPPKKMTEGVADLSRRYKETLFPLLSVLAYVPIKKAYLTDDAGLGKAITGVSLRAVDSKARNLAVSLKEKWTKVIQNESSSSSTAASRPSPSAAASTSTTSAATAKRKPTETSATAESSSKRYKSATPTTLTSATAARAAKPTSASSTSTSVKPGLAFFGGSTIPKKSTSATGSSATSNRMNAHESVMSLMNKLSAGKGNERSPEAEVQRNVSAKAQPQQKPKKRVRWREGNELVAVKEIEPADYSLGDNENASESTRVGFFTDEHDEGLALRQSVSTMEALMDWREPQEVVVTISDSGPVGSESLEGPFQTKRNAEMEEKVHEEGQEPECPDESLLEKPGSISEAPKELLRDSVEIPTPWIGEDSALADGMDESAGEGAGPVDFEQSAPASAVVPSTADLSALLAKVGQAVGGGDVAPSATCTVSVAPPALNFDSTQLQSILAMAKGSGPGSSAVNAAMASQNVSTNNLSALLSNLKSSVNGVHNSVAANNGNAAEGGSGYWNRGYHDASAPKEESYPGEYQQEYSSHGGQRYGQATTLYQYGSTKGWDDEAQGSYGGGQRGGWAKAESGYGGSGGVDGDGDGRGAGVLQPKIHIRPCKFYVQGNCFRGDSCHFRHDG